MTTERMVDSLDSVFDLRIHRALNLPESVSTRVMLTYRKIDNRTTFKVVAAKTTEEMKNKITSWLDDHIHFEDLVSHLGCEEIDMDSFTKASHA